ncbi:MAG: hypothetical protein FWH55_04375 [Oscillospiraceae bacterium]|nr:hypothetical protein [Oscillospiraceae bacterium]
MGAIHDECAAREILKEAPYATRILDRSGCAELDRSECAELDRSECADLARSGCVDLDRSERAESKRER